MKEFIEIKGGVCAARGFKASGVKCGIKLNKLDLALIYSDVPCVAAGLFTANKVKAAPCKLTKENINSGRAQAVIINSGNANCATGKQGIADAKATARSAASGLGINKKEVLVASTGIIGKRLPAEKIKSALPALVRNLSKEGNRYAREAILTTDTHPKEIAVEIVLGGAKVRIGGMAKGAGMICPKLEATMLAFITTDANIEKGALLGALKEAAAASFNSITVDGDMSTNDMALALANGLAGNRRITNDGRDFKKFSSALNFVCINLSDMIVKDGEGATKFVKIAVQGAQNKDDARKVAYKVANSPLVKAALFGNDPNFGRILACVGASGADVSEDKVDIYFADTAVVKNGIAVRVDKEKLAKLVRPKELAIKIGLNSGKGDTVVSTCDLSAEYIKINAEYN